MGQSRRSFFQLEVMNCTSRCGLNRCFQSRLVIVLRGQKLLLRRSARPPSWIVGIKAQDFYAVSAHGHAAKIVNHVSALIDDAHREIACGPREWFKTNASLHYRLAVVSHASRDNDARPVSGLTAANERCD